MGETRRADSGFSIREKLAREFLEKRELSEQLELVWEDKFVRARCVAAQSFSSERVGDTVRTTVLTPGKLDRRWSLQTRKGSRVRGNVVFVEGDDKPYRAWQVKVVRDDGEDVWSDSEVDVQAEPGSPEGESAEGVESSSSPEAEGAPVVEPPMKPSGRQASDPTVGEGARRLCGGTGDE